MNLFENRHQVRYISEIKTLDTWSYPCNRALSESLANYYLLKYAGNAYFTGSDDHADEHYRESNHKLIAIYCS